MKSFKCIRIGLIVISILAAVSGLAAQDNRQNKTGSGEVLKPQTGSQSNDKETVKGEHAEIGVAPSKDTGSSHTLHPDAQWYPDAGLGLFIHWGISSVRAMNISWPMIPGRPLAKRRVNDEERERIIRESDYNLNGANYEEQSLS